MWQRQKEFKAAMIAEIENSDFNPYVIDGCKAQAGTEGYELEVQSYTYGGQSDRRMRGSISIIDTGYHC